MSNSKRRLIFIPTLLVAMLSLLAGVFAVGNKPQIDGSISIGYDKDGYEARVTTDGGSTYRYYTDLDKAVEYSLTTNNVTIEVLKTSALSAEIVVPAGKNITLTSSKAITLTRTATGRFITNNGNLTISGNLTFKDGRVAHEGAQPNSGNSLFGGESQPNSGTLLYSGGAIFNTGTLKLHNTTFTNNTATMYGNAIYNTGTIELSGLFGNTQANQNIYNAGSTPIQVTSALTVTNPIKIDPKVYTDADLGSTLVTATGNFFTASNFAFNISSPLIAFKDGNNLKVAKQVIITLSAGAGATMNALSGWTVGGTNYTQTFTILNTSTAIGGTPSPSKAGYEFNGWYTGEGGTGIKIEITTVIPISHATYTASWTQNSYIVQFNANKPSDASNNVSGTMANQSFTYEQSKNLTANTYGLIGWRFNGWNTQANGNGTSYGDQAQVSKLSTTNNDIVNLYAQWLENSYTITFNPNNGSGTMANQTFNYEDSKALTTNAFTRASYSFTNWNTAANGSGTSYNNQETVSKLSSTNNGTITLYAQWTEDAYATIVINNNVTGGSISGTAGKYYLGEIVSLSYSTNPGYTWAGWVENGSGSISSNKYTIVAGDLGKTITIQGSWTVSTYTITYNRSTSPVVGTGTLPSTQYKDHGTTVYIKNNTSTANGYTQNGWRTSSNGTGTAYANGASYSTNSSRTLYEAWTANTYTVSFNGNGNTGGSTASQSFTYGSSQALRANGFTRTGHSFAGWATSSSGSVAYSDGKEVSNLAYSGTVTLYAKWTANKYTISFNHAGGSGGASGTAQATYGQLVPGYPGGKPSRSGYELQGYFYGGNQYYTSNIGRARNWDIPNDATLVAEWMSTSITIEFSSGYYTSPQTKTITIWSLVGSSSSLTRTSATPKFSSDLSASFSSSTGTITFTLSYASRPYDGQQDQAVYKIGTYTITVIGCFSSDSDITVWDDKKKRLVKKKAKDIKYTDKLLVWNFDEGRYDLASPLTIEKDQIANEYFEVEFSDGSKLEIVIDHQIFNLDQNKFTAIVQNDEHGGASIGTRVLNEKGEAVTIVAKRRIEKDIQFTNIYTKKHLNLYANGLLTSTSFNNLYTIKDLKFVKDNRVIINQELLEGVDPEWRKEMRLDELNDSMLINEMARRYRSTGSFTMAEYIEYKKSVEKPKDETN